MKAQDTYPQSEHQMNSKRTYSRRNAGRICARKQKLTLVGIRTLNKNQFSSSKINIKTIFELKISTKSAFELKN